MSLLRQRSSATWVLALLAALTAAASLPAQLLGPELQVNSYTTGKQTDGRVAADRQGRYVVVWRSDVQDGDGSGIFGQRFGADDLPLGGEFQVNWYTTAQQSTPRVGSDAAGNFVVTWAHKNIVSSWILARRFDASGLAQGIDFQVNEVTTEGTVQRPEIAVDPAGNFVVVWEYADVGILSTCGGTGQRFDASGERVGTQFSVGSGTIFNYYPRGIDSLATTGLGEFVVGYQADCFEPSPFQSGVCNPAVQRFDAAGRVGSQILVDTFPDRFTYKTNVASAGAGDFVVAWPAFSYDGPAPPPSVEARRYDGDGTAQGAVFPVNDNTAVSAGAPAVAVDRKGNFLVVWQSFDQDGSGIFGQRYAADGSGIGNEFQVNSYSTGDQWNASVAAGNVGDFIVSWQSDGQDGASDGVFARRVRSNVFFGGFELGDPCGWSTVVGGGCP